MYLASTESVSGDTEHWSFQYPPKSGRQWSINGVREYSLTERTTGPQGATIVSGVAALGGDCIVMSGAGLSSEGKFEKAALLAKARRLEEIARMLAEHRLRLTYHNHNPEFANHNAEMTGLAENTDPKLISFFMDAGHGYLGGGDPAAVLAAYSTRICGIHLKTFKGPQVSGQVPLGQGDFDFEALAATVKKTGWAGCLVDEEGGGPRPGNTPALGPDREHTRRLFGVLFRRARPRV